MLNKLLKYEFKAQSRLIVPMLFSIVAGGFLASLLMAVELRMPIPYGRFENIMRSSASLLATLLVIAIFAANLVISFLIIQRYYKNFFTDEGYLTFTLPVTEGQQIFTKLFAATIWSIAAFLAFILAILFMVSFGTSSESFFNADMWRDFIFEFDRFWHAMIEEIGVANAVLFIVELALLALVSVPSSFIVFYYAITQGCTAVRKNKILASVGIYLLANIVIQIARNVITAGLFMSVLDFAASLESTLMVLHGLLWVHILFYLGITIIGFFLCRNRLRKKLDLE